MVGAGIAGGLPDTAAVQMQVTTAAMRVAVAIRELDMMPVALVNHQFACRAPFPLPKQRCPRCADRTCYSLPTAVQSRGHPGSARKEARMQSIVASCDCLQSLKHLAAEANSA